MKSRQQRPAREYARRRTRAAATVRRELVPPCPFPCPWPWPCPYGPCRAAAAAIAVSVAPMRRTRQRRRPASAHRLQALHRVLHPGPGAGANGPGRADPGRGAPRSGQHRHRVCRAARRQHRPVPRLHRHHRAGDLEGPAGHLAAGLARRPGAAGPGGGRGPGFPQRLRAGHARRRGGAPEHQAAVRLGGASGVETGPEQRIHRPYRRLARCGAALRPGAAPGRPGPRPGL